MVSKSKASNKSQASEKDSTEPETLDVESEQAELARLKEAYEARRKALKAHQREQANKELNDVVAAIAEKAVADIRAEARKRFKRVNNVSVYYRLKPREGQPPFKVVHAIVSMTAKEREALAEESSADEKS